MLTTDAAEVPPVRFVSTLTSPLAGVSLPAWRRFVAALELEDVPGQAPRPRRMDQVSVRGGFGSYDLRPKRLQELGYVADLERQGGRAYKRQPQVYACRFLAPHTRDRFLADPTAQLRALSISMRSYQDDFAAGRLVRPAGLSLAGALALLHCGGRGALAAYPGNVFPHTRAVLERAQGAF